MNMIIMSLSVFACVKEKKTRPSESKAAINASLGFTILSVELAGEPAGAHMRRLYYD